MKNSLSVVIFSIFGLLTTNELSLAANPSQTVDAKLKGISSQLDPKAGSNLNASQLQRVIADLSGILKKNPGLTQARYLRAVALIGLHKSKEAMSDLDEVIKQNPKHGKARWWRGNELFMSGQFRSALNDFSAAIGNGEKDAKVYMNRGAAYQQLQENKKAIEDFTVALSKSSDLWPARLMRGNAYYESNQFDLALKDFDSVLAQPKVPRKPRSDAEKKRGFTFFKLGRYEDAITALTKAADLLSGEEKGAALFIRGGAHHKLGHESDALADLKAAKELGFPPESKALPDRVVRAEGDRKVKELNEKLNSLSVEARKGLPAIKKRFHEGIPRGHQLMLTTRLTGPDHEFEQVFVHVNSWTDDKIVATLASDVRLKNHKKGETLQLKEADIVDWTIVRPDGSEEGNLLGKFLDSYQP